MINMDLTYGDVYFYAHDVNMVNVLANVFAGAFNTSAFGNVDNLTVSVYNVALGDVVRLVDDLGFTHMVHDVAYADDYDYYDNLVADTDCVVLYCNRSLYDLDDL